VERHGSILGVVFDFNRGETFTGLVGKGAWLNGRSIRLSDVTEKIESCLMYRFSGEHGFFKRGFN